MLKLTCEHLRFTKCSAPRVGREGKGGAGRRLAAGMGKREQVWRGKREGDEIGREEGLGKGNEGAVANNLEQGSQKPRNGPV